MKNLGQLGEDMAAKYYESLGYTVLDRNYVFPYGKRIGELDLVCRFNNEIIFVEVKLRSSSVFGTPFEAVDKSKQRKLVKMAKLYMELHPDFLGLNYRIDVVAVAIDKTGEPVTILSNAIEDSE
jgi:putative endonuclease